MAALVITNWKAGDKALDAQGTRVLIEGRNGGLVAWLLHLVQIEPATRLRITAERAELETASLSGKEHLFVPLENICHCFYGYHKPWRKALLLLVASWWMLTWIFPLVAAIVSRDVRIYSGTSTVLGGVLAAIVALGIAVAYYLLTKSFLLSFVTRSGRTYQLLFRRSIIENQKIDAEEAAYVTEILDYLCDSRRRPQV